jgi:hypothetical protein
MDHGLFAVFTHEDLNPSLATPGRVVAGQGRRSCRLRRLHSPDRPRPPGTLACKSLNNVRGNDN